MQTHVKKMTELLDETALVVGPVDQDSRVVHLLASLPRKYDVLVTALEAGAEVPKWAVAVERLLHEERKLKSRAAEKTSAQEEEALAASYNRRLPGGRELRCFGCGKLGHIRRHCRQSEEVRSQKGKRRAYCATEDYEGAGLMVSHALTTSRIPDSTMWIMDSGATSHMCKNRDMFSELHTLERAQDVTLGDGRTLKATGRGKVRLLMDLPVCSFGFDRLIEVVCLQLLGP